MNEDKFLNSGCFKGSNNPNYHIFETSTENQKEKLDVFRGIAQKIKSALSPRSVLTLGDGHEFLVESLREIGVEAYCSDIPKNRISQERDDNKGYVSIDSGSNFLTTCKKYDLITCIGAIEPLSEEEGVKAIQNMVQYSDSILFAFSDNFDNPLHINVQPSEYWVSIFGKLGYALDISYDASFLCSQALLFRKRKYLDFSLLSRPLRIFILSSNANDACAEVRLCRPLSYFEKHNKLALRIFSPNRKRPPSLDNINWADLVIFQRIKSSFWKPYLKRAKKNKIPVIYEIDDNLLQIPPKHPQYSYWKKIENNPKYLWYLRNADCITTTTRPMAYYLKKFNNNIFLLPNYIDATLFPSQEREKEKTATNGKIFTIGYAGTITHSYDFELICSTLKKVNKSFSDKIRFHFFGFAPSELLKETNVSFDGRNFPYFYYLNNIYQKNIDLGLAPLSDNFFNECKSNIKFLEYTLLGIPGIYSKVGPYKDTIKDGVTGFLVKENNQEQWLETLRYIIERPEILNEIRFNAQKYVDTSFMLKDHYREWWDTYLDTIIRIRGELK